MDKTPLHVLLSREFEDLSRRGKRCDTEEAQSKRLGVSRRQLKRLRDGLVPLTQRTADSFAARLRESAPASKRDALAVELLKASRESLADDAKKPTVNRRGPSTRRLLEEDDYLRQQEAYLAATRAAGVDVQIWLLGPESLPVAESKEVQEVWAKNLADGFSYNILWLFDVITGSTFQHLTPALAATARAAMAMNPQTHKHVKHYAATLLPVVTGVEHPLKTEYLGLAKEFEKSDCVNIFHQPWTPTDNEGKTTLMKLLRYYNPLGPVVAYCPIKPEEGTPGDTPAEMSQLFEPLAAVGVRVTTKWAEASSSMSGFAFLPNKDSIALVRLLKTFEAKLRAWELENGGPLTKKREPPATAGSAPTAGPTAGQRATTSPSTAVAKKRARKERGR